MLRNSMDVRKTYLMVAKNYINKKKYFVLKNIFTIIPHNTNIIFL